MLDRFARVLLLEEGEGVLEDGAAPEEGKGHFVDVVPDRLGGDGGGALGKVGGVVAEDGGGGDQHEDPTGDAGDEALGLGQGDGVGGRLGLQPGEHDP